MRELLFSSFLVRTLGSIAVWVTAFVPSAHGSTETDVALLRPVVASGHHADNVGAFAVDGDSSTRWENRARNRIVQLEVDLGGPHVITRAEVVTGVGSGHAPQFVQLLYHDGFCWLPIPGATVDANPADQRTLDLPFTEAVVADRIRYHSLDESNNLLEELRVFGQPTDPVPPSTGGCASGQHRAARGPWYDAAIHLPPDYNLDPDRRWPLIFSMHGIGGEILTADHLSVRGAPEGLALQIANGSLADFDAVVVSGHCRAVGQTSNCWFDADRVLAMLAELRGDWLVDPDRVFVTGLSGGGIVSYRLGIDHPELFAGVVPVASNAPNGTEQPRCNLKKTNVWAFGGTEDPSFPANVNEGVLNHLRDQCDPVGVSYMQATAIEGGTHSGSTWNAAYSTPELHAWFTSTVRRAVFRDGFESGSTGAWGTSASP